MRLSLILFIEFDFPDGQQPNADGEYFEKRPRSTMACDSKELWS
jgi:hypothetical protein